MSVVDQPDDILAGHVRSIEDCPDADLRHRHSRNEISWLLS
jgi:hypothetical protein